MGALVFDSCCFCFDLRVGCLIIGYLNLIYSIISLISSTVVAFAVEAAVQHDEDLREELSKHVSVAAISIIFIVLIVVYLLFLILNIVFVVGLHQNKPGHVKAYLIFNLIFLVIIGIVFLVSFAGSPINWGNAIQLLIVILLSTYFLLVIRSYYYKMKDTSRQPAIYNTA